MGGASAPRRRPVDGPPTVGPWTSLPQSARGRASHRRPVDPPPGHRVRPRGTAAGRGALGRDAGVGVHRLGDGLRCGRGVHAPTPRVRRRHHVRRRLRHGLRVLRPPAQGHVFPGEGAAVRLPGRLRLQRPHDPVGRQEVPARVQAAPAAPVHLEGVGARVEVRRGPDRRIQGLRRHGVPVVVRALEGQDRLPVHRDALPRGELARVAVDPRVVPVGGQVEGREEVPELLDQPRVGAAVRDAEVERVPEGLLAEARGVALALPHPPPVLQELAQHRAHRGVGLVAEREPQRDPGHVRVVEVGVGPRVDVVEDHGIPPALDHAQEVPRVEQLLVEVGLQGRVPGDVVQSLDDPDGHHEVEEVVDRSLGIHVDLLHGVGVQVVVVGGAGVGVHDDQVVLPGPDEEVPPGDLPRLHEHRPDEAGVLREGLDQCLIDVGVVLHGIVERSHREDLPHHLVLGAGVLPDPLALGEDPAGVVPAVLAVGLGLGEGGPVVVEEGDHVRVGHGDRGQIGVAVIHEADAPGHEAAAAGDHLEDVPGLRGAHHPGPGNGQVRGGGALLLEGDVLERGPREGHPAEEAQVPVLPEGRQDLVDVGPRHGLEVVGLVLGQELGDQVLRRVVLGVHVQGEAEGQRGDVVELAPVPVHLGVQRRVLTRGEDRRGGR